MDLFEDASTLTSKKNSISTLMRSENGTFTSASSTTKSKTDKEQSTQWLERASWQT